VDGAPVAVATVSIHRVVRSDGVVLVDLARSVQRADETREVLTPVGDALYSHLLCFAAEDARIRGTVVDMTSFRDRAEEGAENL
jgi:hypothetical protein